MPSLWCRQGGSFPAALLTPHQPKETFLSFKYVLLSEEGCATSPGVDFFLDGPSLLNIIKDEKQCIGHENDAKL